MYFSSSDIYYRDNDELDRILSKVEINLSRLSSIKNEVLDMSSFEEYKAYRPGLFNIFIEYETDLSQIAASLKSILGRNRKLYEYFSECEKTNFEMNLKLKNLEGKNMELFSKKNELLRQINELNSINNSKDVFISDLLCNLRQCKKGHEDSIRNRARQEDFSSTMYTNLHYKYDLNYSYDDSNQRKTDLSSEWNENPLNYKSSLESDYMSNSNGENISGAYRKENQVDEKSSTGKVLPQGQTTANDKITRIYDIIVTACKSATIAMHLEKKFGDNLIEKISSGNVDEAFLKEVELEITQMKKSKQEENKVVKEKSQKEKEKDMITSLNSYMSNKNRLDDPKINKVYNFRDLPYAWRSIKEYFISNRELGMSKSPEKITNKSINMSN